MNTQMHNLKLIIAASVTTLLLSACSSISSPEGSAEVREKLTLLQANQELASRAPVAIKEAEVAVRAAEIPEKDKELARHRVYIADHKVDIAAARAQGRLYEYQRAGLTKASENARLDSRTREADIARAETNSAREETEAVRLKNNELKRQLAELNARETDRGMIVTLGDVLFATGRSELNTGAISNLNKLGAFLTEYPDRIVAIEGHTDNVGSETSNIRLSQMRSASVRSYLINRGIASDRFTSAGLGESSPIADNDTATGRQQNRRVEVIISIAKY